MKEKKFTICTILMLLSIVAFFVTIILFIFQVIGPWSSVKDIFKVILVVFLWSVIGLFSYAPKNNNYSYYDDDSDHNYCDYDDYIDDPMDNYADSYYDEC